jgi:hypothetical protein
MKDIFVSAKLKIASFSVRNNRGQLPFSQIFQQRKLPERAEPVSVNLFKEPRNRFPAWQAGGIDSSKSIPGLLKRLFVL